MIASHPQRNINVILDIGAHRSNIGISGDQAPQLSTYSYLINDKSMNIDDYRYYVGDYQLQEDRNNVDIMSIFDGNSKSQINQIDYEKYMSFVECALSEKLKLGRELLSILITEDSLPSTPVSGSMNTQLTKQRQKICQIMFQELNINNVCFIKKPVATSISVGKTNSVVLDSGHTATRVSIVQDGYVVSSKNIAYSGNTINQLIKQKLTNNINLPIQKAIEPYKQSYIDFHKFLTVQAIKHSFKSQYQLLATTNNKSQMSQQYSTRISYILPDGNQITLNREQILDPFVNFGKYYKKYIEQATKKISQQSDQDYKSHIDYKSMSEYRSLSRFLKQTIDSYIADEYQQDQSSAKIMRKQLYKNIVLTGGNMKFSDISTKFAQQIKSIEKQSRIIISPVLAKQLSSQHKKSYPIQNSSAFVGGSMLTQLSIFNNFWISQSQWKQIGQKATIPDPLIQPIDNPLITNSAAYNNPISTNPSKSSQKINIRTARNNLVSKKCP